MPRLIFAVLLLTGLAGGLRADLAGAKAAHTRGLQLEKAKQYQAAIQAYEAALAAEPRYAYSYKQIGNCKYFLGDKAGALRAYDSYLAVLKNDAKTRAFADALRKQVGAQAPAQAAAGASATQAQAGRWRLGLDLGYHLLSFKEWNEDIKPTTPDPNQSSVATVGSGLSVGLATGYRVMPKLELGLDLDYFLVSAVDKYKSGGFESTQTYNFNAVWIGPFAAYDLASMPNGLSFNVGLGAGFLMLMGAGFDSKSTAGGGGTKATFSGSALGFKVKLGGAWQLGPSFGLNLDLGYRLATVPKVEFSGTNSAGQSFSGTYKRNSTGTGTAADMPLDYSGVDLQLGGAWRF